MTIVKTKWYVYDKLGKLRGKFTRENAASSKIAWLDRKMGKGAYVKEMKVV